MRSSIKSLILMLVLVVTFQSCNQDPTLQSYYVDSELAPGFTSLDVPVSMLKIDEEALNEEEAEAYDSVDKLSLLAYVLENGNEEEYKTELSKVRDILKDSKYQELMRGGNTTDGKFVVKFVGTEDSIDEVILMGHANEKGFAVARILGDDMNVNKMMVLSKVFERTDINDSEIMQFADFFK